MAAQDDPHYAYRVTFEYDGDQVRKVAQQRVAMTAPPSHDLASGDEVGFWYELRDASNNPVYRRVVQNPMQGTVEVFSQDGGIVRRPVQDPRGVFQVVVPEIADASNLVLIGTPQPIAPPIGSRAEERARPAIPRVGTTPAREIARFDLSEDANEHI
jgi:hypothetical protein